MKLENLSRKAATNELRRSLSKLDKNVIPKYSVEIQAALKNIGRKSSDELFSIAQEIVEKGDLPNNICRTFHFVQPSGKLISFDGKDFLERFLTLLEYIKEKREHDPTWR
jgi:hypothetical protein